MKELYDLKEILCKELKEYGEKGELTAGTLDVVDKLAHTIKNLDKIIEVYDEEGYSGHYPYWAYDNGNMGGNSSRRSYRGSYGRGGSYAQRRDSRGRYSNERGYSREGYSRNDLADKMRELMDEAPDDRTRQEIQRMVEKLENA